MKRVYKISGKLVLLLLLSTILNFIFPNSIEASEGTYYVKPVLSKNQHKDILDYYSFDSPQKLDTTLEVLIVNESDEEKSFTISLLDAFTSDSISIYYDVDQTYDDTLKFKFSEFGKVKEPVTVKANNNQIVKIPLKKEMTNFNGTILGGINIVEDKLVDEKSGGVTNVFAYNIPVRIDVDNKNPKDKLTYDGVELATDKYKHVLKTTFRNEQSKLIRDINFSFKIESKDKEKKVYYDEKKESLQIAPNSIFFPKISLEKSDITAGTYLLTIKASNEDYNEEWESEFTITKKEAENLNNGFSVTGSDKKSFEYWWLVILIVLIIIITIAIILYQKNQKKKAILASTLTKNKIKKKKKNT